jgi:hypothetical protein
MARPRLAARGSVALHEPALIPDAANEALPVLGLPEQRDADIAAHQQPPAGVQADLGVIRGAVPGIGDMAVPDAVPRVGLQRQDREPALTSTGMGSPGSRVMPTMRPHNPSGQGAIWITPPPPSVSQSPTIGG